MKPVQKVMEDADLQKTEIDEIVLVGGSTRIPKVQQLVKEYFNGKVGTVPPRVARMWLSQVETVLYVYFLTPVRNYVKILIVSIMPILPRMALQEPFWVK